MTANGWYPNRWFLTGWWSDGWWPAYAGIVPAYVGPIADYTSLIYMANEFASKISTEWTGDSVFE